MKKKSLTGSLPPPKRSFAAICLAREQALSILTCLCLPRLQTLGIIHGFTFCFADCVSSAGSISLLLFWDIFFRRLFFRPMPQCVHFLTCKTTVPDTYGLLLYCYPNFKKAEVEKKLSSYDIPYQGEGKSREPACVGDGIVVSPSSA